MSTPIPGGSEPTVKSKFWVGFAAGMGTMAVLIVLVFLGLGYSGLFSIRPQLAVNATVAETVRIGEAFVARIETSNPHEEAVELDNIAIPNRVFEAFEVLSVSSAVASKEAVGIWVWYFQEMVQPGETKTVELTLQPNKPGNHVLELDICNGYEDCSTVTRLIEVQELP